MLADLAPENSVFTDVIEKVLRSFNRREAVLSQNIEHRCRCSEVVAVSDCQARPAAAPTHVFLGDLTSSEFISNNAVNFIVQLSSWRRTLLKCCAKGR